MMTHETIIDEQVKVWAFFDPSASSGQGIFPIAINWRRRLVKFSRLIFVSSKKVGEVKIINLVCASDGANYELEFDTNNYLWKLKKVMAAE